MILGIHHAQITIPQDREQEGKDFYIGVLGLQEVDKPHSLQGRGGFWLKVGDRDVHVGTENGFDRTKTKAHLAYEVDNINAWRDKLKKEGIEILEGIPIPGYERFEFRDPFGNRVEMIAEVG
ncbi:VOC family protein [Bacillus sp. KH172YL63]|uniref:VOC family protein n=1 Tax=Bacillus sp. KH172YL63 TaxID=2709784 RepID=UPI0013E4890B|nr:VOC family protein [Bacillus sp. KH172YL63]BCB04054.1 glyoxalase [Bacillus sp. KH172YL63]